MADAEEIVADWVVSAGSTSTFGRVVLAARAHHLVVDGPVSNGCLGEAITPAELFLGAVASCAAELIQVIAGERSIPLTAVHAEVAGKIDRAHEVRDDVTVFSHVWVRFALRGVGDEVAAALVDAFKARCPLYGTVAVASANVEVTFTAEA